MGNIGLKSLYRYSRVGTKKLIEQYLDEICSLLDCVAEKDEFFENLSIPLLPFNGLYQFLDPPTFLKTSPNFVTLKKLSFFSDLRHTLGNSALMLSGGATLGIHHIGILKSLYEQRILPRILSGSSAGAIVASMVAVRLDSEIQEILSSLDDVSWHFFEEPTKRDFPLTRIARQLIRLLRDGAVFDSEVLSEFLKEHVGEKVTFLEAYNRTRRVLNVAVSSTTSFEMPRLLNYLTAPDVIIWTAVAASCAAPTLFKSGKILIKLPSGDVAPWSGCNDATWMDGSVENDLPISRVNPHVVPFLVKGGGIRESKLDRFKRTICHVIREEILFRLPMLVDLHLIPKSFGYLMRNILSQQYEGDVTIVPSTIALTDILNIFTAPTLERVHSSVLRGERATWPLLAFIKAQTQIEMKLDKILYALKCQLLEQRWPIPRSPMTEKKEEKELWNGDKAAVPPLLSELKWSISIHESLRSVISKP